VVKNNGTNGNYFSRIGDEMNIRTNLSRFQIAIKSILTLLPQSATDELDNNLNIIQSLIRLARKELGQPSCANPPSRDQVYIRLCHVAVPRARSVGASGIVRQLRLQSATWSSRHREVRGAFGRR